MQRHRVRALLMGGQACVLYGAAEFSRDTDFAIFARPANLKRLRAALAELQAAVIAIPPFDLRYLRRGHAVHFRCRVPGASGLRIDVMTRMRGVAPFPTLWRRRTTVRLPGRLVVQLLSLPDLVQAKKTQRDKDWPMLRRLVEAHYFAHRGAARPEHRQFWFCELRTADLLVEVARRWPGAARRASVGRPLLRWALRARPTALEKALAREEAAERAADRRYWEPLERELATLRRTRRSHQARSAGTK